LKLTKLKSIKKEFTPYKNEKDRKGLTYQDIENRQKDLAIKALKSIEKEVKKQKPNKGRTLPIKILKSIKKDVYTCK